MPHPPQNRTLRWTWRLSTLCLSLSPYLISCLVLPTHCLSSPTRHNLRPPGLVWTRPFIPAVGPPMQGHPHHLIFPQTISSINHPSYVACPPSESPHGVHKIGFLLIPALTPLHSPAADLLSQMASLPHHRPPFPFITSAMVSWIGTIFFPPPFHTILLPKPELATPTPRFQTRRCFPPAASEDFTPTTPATSFSVRALTSRNRRIMAPSSGPPDSVCPVYHSPLACIPSRCTQPHSLALTRSSWRRLRSMIRSRSSATLHPPSPRLECKKMTRRRL